MLLGHVMENSKLSYMILWHQALLYSSVRSIIVGGILRTANSPYFWCNNPLRCQMDLVKYLAVIMVQTDAGLYCMFIRMKNLLLCDFHAAVFLRMRVRGL